MQFEAPPRVPNVKMWWRAHACCNLFAGVANAVAGRAEGEHVIASRPVAPGQSRRLNHYMIRFRCFTSPRTNNVFTKHTRSVNVFGVARSRPVE